MKFKSKKDVLFKITVLGSNVILTLIMVSLILKGQVGIIQLVIIILLLSIIVFWLWTYFGTEYKLTDTEFVFKSGPIKRKIRIERIKEIVKGQTLWIGNWPATARRGLIIKYDKYNLVNISPETNERFIAAILKINNRVKVTE